MRKPQGFLHWGVRMRVRVTDNDPREIWSVWDEEYVRGGITARCHLADGTLDRIMRARDYAYGHQCDLRASDLAAMV